MFVDDNDLSQSLLRKNLVNSQTGQAGSPRKNSRNFRSLIADLQAENLDTESDYNHKIEQALWEYMVSNEEILSRLIPMPSHLITREEYEELPEPQLQNFSYKVISNDQVARAANLAQGLL